jgi:hypothetical protein
MRDKSNNEENDNRNRDKEVLPELQNRSLTEILKALAQVIDRATAGDEEATFTRADTIIPSVAMNGGILNFA